MFDFKNKDFDCWEPHRISLAYSLGEIRQFRVFFNGIRRHPNIFKTPEISCPNHPKQEMEKHAVKSAFLYSCPISKQFPAFSIKNNYICYVASFYKHYYVYTNGDFGAYLNRLSKKTKATLLRKIKKVENVNKGKQYFKIYSSVQELETFYEFALDISKKTYQEKLFHHGLPETTEFYKKLRNDAKMQRITGYLLFFDDKPIAYNLCPIYDQNKLLYHFTGYDPDYEKYSPGTVLQFKIIENLFENPKIDFYDLCTGEGRHKELFATDSKLCANIYYFPFMGHYILLVVMHYGLNKMVYLMGKFLNRFSLKDKIKKYIRRKS